VEAGEACIRRRKPARLAYDERMANPKARRRLFALYVIRCCWLETSPRLREIVQHAQSWYILTTLLHCLAQRQPSMYAVTQLLSWHPEQ